MRIPQHVINDMHRAARHAAACAEIMERVNTWFESRGFTPEELRCCDGCSLEELEYGNDITDEIVHKYERIEPPKEETE